MKASRTSIKNEINIMEVKITNVIKCSHDMQYAVESKR